MIEKRIWRHRTVREVAVQKLKGNMDTGIERESQAVRYAAAIFSCYIKIQLTILPHSCHAATVVRRSIHWGIMWGGGAIVLYSASHAMEWLDDCDTAETTSCQ